MCSGASTASCSSTPTRKGRALESSWSFQPPEKWFALSRTIAPSFPKLLPPPHPLIHRLIRQPVGFLVAAAQRMPHLKPVQPGGQPRASCHRGSSPGLFTLYWPFICFTISSESETTRMRLALLASAHSQHGQQAGVLGVVVGLHAQEAAEARDYAPSGFSTTAP